MSDRHQPLRHPTALKAGFIATVLLGTSLALATPATACTPVAMQIEFCPESTVWADMRGQNYGGVMAWEGEEMFLEFNPELMSAAAPDGPLAAALDALLAVIMAEEAAADVVIETLRRDRFETARVTTERMVMQIEEEGETYLGALMLSEISDGPRLAWSLGSLDAMELDTLLVLIEATAAGLRLSGGN